MISFCWMYCSIHFVYIKNVQHSFKIVLLGDAIVQLTTRQVSDGEVAGAPFNIWTGYAALELCFPSESSRLLVVVAQPYDKYSQTEPKKRCSALVWFDHMFRFVFFFLHCSFALQRSNQISRLRVTVQKLRKKSKLFSSTISSFSPRVCF